MCPIVHWVNTPIVSSSVVVFGAGAVGMAGVMAAKALGAATVIAVDKVAERLQLARELGATHTLLADGTTDVVIGMGASTDSSVNRNRLAGMDFAAIASFNLLEKAVAAARAKNINVKVGNVFTSDLFYNPDETLFDTLEKYGVLAVEMEAAGLYGVAAEYGINALAIFTVSDHIRTGEALSAELRQTSFNEMVEVALGCL